MKYLFLLHGDAEVEERLPESERTRIVQEHMAYGQMLRDLGVYVSGEALDDPRGTALVVRPGPQPTVTDGPFSETKEAIGGFYVVDVESREQVVELAGKVPVSPGLAVEVLAIAEL
jgi:hypothetical protein